ncbi:dienelactone hydrolase family protein [Nonomuraea sp. NPDC050556]|uniref:dienelactone hydrolase family protein n=1 Tax=Nonomuraea sp. NPDC050556 TaxID=3364369 RepID=UPI00379B5F59
MNILMVLTSHATLGSTGRRTGFYVSEAAHPWEIFTAAGHQVDVASVAGGVPPRDGEDPSDAAQRRFLDALGATPSVADVDASAYDAIFFAGGHGTMWDFPDNPHLARLTREVYEGGGVVAAVCHGPSALAGVTLSDGTPLVAGKRVSAFTNAEEEAVGLTAEVPFLLADRLVAEGATHVPGPDFGAQVVTDGRLVTGQNPASARGVAEAVVSTLSKAAEASSWVDLGGMRAYVARPRVPGSYPGVIVAHQLFGVTADIREAADRIAALGYVAIAPEFYHRAEPGVELAADDAGRERGFALMNTLTREGVLADVRAAMDYLGTARPVGMLGLSMGGHLAYYAATQVDLAVTVVLYAGWLTGTDIPVSRPSPTLELTGGIRGRLLYLVGSDDHVITAEQRQRIAARLEADGVDHEMIVYPGAAHAFLSTDVPAAEEAWKTIEEALGALTR